MIRRYEKGSDERVPYNQDAVLRWNSYARIINTHPEVKPGEVDTGEMSLDSYEIPH